MGGGVCYLKFTGTLVVYCLTVLKIVENINFLAFVSLLNAVFRPIIQYPNCNLWTSQQDLIHAALNKTNQACKKARCA